MSKVGEKVETETVGPTPVSGAVSHPSNSSFVPIGAIGMPRSVSMSSDTDSPRSTGQVFSPATSEQSHLFAPSSNEHPPSENTPLPDVQHRIKMDGK